MKSLQNLKFKIFAALCVMVLLSGCAGMELEKARMVAPKGTDFSMALNKEYLRLSELEFLEGDYKDSDVFAIRAIQSANNTPPAPEALEARDLPATHKGVLAEARRELVDALAATATEKAPVHAAMAQAAFDCWMQEQEENFQPDDIAACRSDYEAAMKAVKLALAPAPAAAAPAPAPKAAERMAATFTVNFDFDSDSITGAASAIIAEAGKVIDEMKASTVILSGYTDRAGPESYNMKLADRRAKSVLSALEIRSNKKITGLTQFKVYGENNNLVKTEDGVKNAENRRVKIEIIR